MKRICALALAFLAVVVATVSAHDTWLLPSSLRVSAGQPVRLSLTSGMGFPADDVAVQPARVARAHVRLAGRSAPLGAPRVGSLSTLYEWTPANAGVATIGVALGARTLELTASQIDEYFEEIHATPAMRAAWDSVPKPRRWRESYVKHAKTHVRVGAPPAGDSSWREPAGLGLELVAERDPTMLRAGDTLVIRALEHGRPAVGLEIGAIREGAKARFFTTDANGRARIVLPVAGLWLLNGTSLRRAREPGLEWRSDFTTLTIAVQ